MEFWLRNDTSATLRLHTGTSTSTIAGGTTSRYAADVGQEFRLFDGAKGALLFEVAPEMDGETLRLSEFV